MKKDKYLYAESFNDFELELDQIKRDIKLLEEKKKNVYENLDKLSIFRLYMGIKESKGITPKISVRHRNIFRTSCDYHRASDMPFYIYDDIGKCCCYGCGEELTTLDLIKECIKESVGTDAKIRFDSIDVLAIEVADAMINGVRYELDSDGGLIGESKEYSYVNDKGLMIWLLDMIYKRYDSSTAQKYFDMSIEKARAEDDRISRYINTHGISVNSKLAKRLCLSGGYVKERLYSGCLNSKLDINRIVELGKIKGEKARDINILPFGDSKDESEGLNSITIYENNDDILKVTIARLTKLFESYLFYDTSFIKNVSIEDNVFKFSIIDSSGNEIKYEICVKKQESIKDAIYTSVYEKESRPSLNALSIISADYDSGSFPTEESKLVIQALETNGVAVLFSNGEYTSDINNSPYILNYKPVTGSEFVPFWAYCRYSYQDMADPNLERFLYSLFSSDVPSAWMLGEMVIRTSLPEVWKEKGKVKVTK